MTATEVIERTNEKGILLAPTVGRQQSEYLGPMIDRELDLMAQMGMLDPMPPRLKEAGGTYGVVYTSPLSRAMRAQEAAGFMRTVESVKELVAVSGRRDLLYPFNFKKAIPEMAEINGVKPSWMNSEDEMALLAEADAKATAREQQIQAAPGAAALINAGTKQQQAGVAPAGAPVQ